MLSRKDAAMELMRRRSARSGLHDYISYCNSNYKRSLFSDTVCRAMDNFLVDVDAGKRPILILSAPPQHGKSTIVSQYFPAFLLGRNPGLRIGAASYSDLLAGTMAQEVRRNLASEEHRSLFPVGEIKDKFAISRQGEFTAPGGTGSYLGVGVGAGLTGRPMDIGIIDDPIRGATEALSPTTKESIWNWYQSVFKTRLSDKSGQLIMQTRWATDDLSGRIIDLHSNDSRLTLLSFPALNAPGETGYNPQFPEGALVPELHSEAQLVEIKSETSSYFWNALYQQCPVDVGGNVFRVEFIRYYLPKMRPVKFDKVVISWDCTFKDSDGSDFVVGQVWGRTGADCYLVDQVRGRLSFTATVEAVRSLRSKYPEAREVLIEDKANGPAVIDMLSKTIPGIIPIEPDGSKLARAHAITAYWEGRNIYLPDPSLFPWVKDLISEIITFPAAAHDDQVDSMTQAIRRLFPSKGSLAISKEALRKFGAR